MEGATITPAMIYIVSFMVALITILLAIVAFFLKQISSEFKEMKTAINGLNEKMAVVVTKQEYHQQQLHGQEIFEERIDKELKSVRDRYHKLANLVNGLAGQFEIQKETCPMRHKRNT